jgi:dephospho-CoA kinase
MMKVGITGGMGSGKSYAAKIFEALSIPVFYADEESKSLLNTHQKVKQNLSSRFGMELYKNNVLDRDFLAKQIFNNPKELAFVNSVVHPAVAERFLEWSAEQNAPYCLKEAAILFETGSYKELDKTILVVADKDLRVDRVMKRNDWSRQEVLARMKNQWTDSEKIPLADFVIYNNEKEMLTPQILKIHEDLIRAANAKS